MNIFFLTSRNKIKQKIPDKVNLLKTICVLLVGFFLLQVLSPGLAFCLKEGNRVIQCRSLWPSTPPPVVDEAIGTACCNKTCKEKPPVNSQNRSSSGENEKGGCCISISAEHEGVLCLSFSVFHPAESVSFIDHIKPFIKKNGFIHYNNIDKPPSLIFLRSVILIV